MVPVLKKQCRGMVVLVCAILLAGGFGGEALQATIDQTSVSLYGGICIADWRGLLVRGEPGHWGGIVGLRSLGPWSQGRRYCAGGHFIVDAAQWQQIPGASAGVRQGSEPGPRRSRLGGACPPGEKSGNNACPCAPGSRNRPSCTTH